MNKTIKGEPYIPCIGNIIFRDMEDYLDYIVEGQEGLGKCPHCNKKFTKYDLFVYNKGNDRVNYSHQGRCIDK